MELKRYVHDNKLSLLVLRWQKTEVVRIVAIFTHIPLVCYLLCTWEYVGESVNSEWWYRLVRVETASFACQTVSRLIGVLFSLGIWRMWSFPPLICKHLTTHTCPPIFFLPKVLGVRIYEWCASLNYFTNGHENVVREVWKYLLHLCIKF